MRWRKVLRTSLPHPPDFTLVWSLFTFSTQLGPFRPNIEIEAQRLQPQSLTVAPCIASTHSRRPIPVRSQFWWQPWSLLSLLLSLKVKPCKVLARCLCRCKRQHCHPRTNAQRTLLCCPPCYRWYASCNPSHHESATNLPMSLSFARA